MSFDPVKTALLTIDLQNDFLHPEGAYGRAGQSAEAIAASLRGRHRSAVCRDSGKPSKRRELVKARQRARGRKNLGVR